MASLKPEDLVVGEKYSIRYPVGVPDDPVAVNLENAVKHAQRK
jgi:hypothetical protein